MLPSSIEQRLIIVDALMIGLVGYDEYDKTLLGYMYDVLITLNRAPSSDDATTLQLRKDVRIIS